MKFDKIIGNSSDPKVKELVRKAEEKLSSVFTELSLGWDNTSMGTGIGGDPLVFQLVYPLPHLCDLQAIQIDELKNKIKDQENRIKNGEIIPDNEKISDETKHFRRQMSGKVLRTAATDGRRYYWNPQFVIDQERLGLRIVVAHEAFHAIYLHPSRRGSRIHKLWNIAVDYRVNFTIMEDLKARGVKDHPKVFTDNLGEYIHLEEYAAFLRDPFHPPPRLAHFNPTIALRKMADPAYKDPGDDTKPMYYADHALSDDMKRPENVYEYLLAQIPKCPKCGKLGKYKKPEEYKALEKKIKEQEEKKKAEAKKKEAEEKKKLPQAPEEPKCCKEHKHDEEGDECCDHNHEQDAKKVQPGQGKPDENGKQTPGQGEPSDDDACCGEKGDKGCDEGCGECGGDDYEYIDPFGSGETLDDHIDSDISEEELAKRITDAMEITKRMAGKIPGALEDELGTLIAPTLSVWDFIRSRLLKVRNGLGKNDWMRPKSRPMFGGLYVPKKKTYTTTFLAAYDCSGSMSQEDISFGISQLQCLGDVGEGYLLPWDSVPYFDSMIKIKKANVDELKNAKVKGRGGTAVSDVFNQYEEHCPEVDMIVIITDGFLFDGELVNAKRPGKNVDTVWIITSHNPNFKPPWGRVFHLHGEKL